METVDMNSPDDLALAEKMKVGRDRVIGELKKLIVGQDDVVEQVLLTLFVGGNSLITGVPGLAKTLLVTTLAQRARPRLLAHPVHARPDALRHHRHRDHPGGRGTGRRSIAFVAPGPIFANIVLADEINRTPPKTQAALLEAMQEHHVTVRARPTARRAVLRAGHPEPDRAGGHLPAARGQLDRFMFNIIIDHPPLDEELEVVRDHPADKSRHSPAPSPGPDLVAFQRLVRRVPVSQAVMNYAVDLVRKTRPITPSVPISSRSGSTSAHPCAPLST